jgi:hypothetical protein
VDPGLRTPLVDSFRRVEVAREKRIDAAQGAFAPRALDQIALLLILADDADAEIAQLANATLDAIPREAMASFLARTDVTGEMRDWFAARGIVSSGEAMEGDEPLAQTDAAVDAPAPKTPEVSGVQRLATMSVMEKMKVATRGTREERTVLIRDPNRLVASAVLSSPKLTETEVEQIARMANVAEEVLRVIGTNRAWIKNYTVAANLVRNPKTPVAISMNLMNRLTEKDVKMLTTDRNVPEPLRVAARKRVAESASRRG